ncbi:MAG: tandem-95 repeat protein, partial [Burkholderiales bacterium]|nr:tandem-95 repeat protein [Burkholderiales bacterium]
MRGNANSGVGIDTGNDGWSVVGSVLEGNQYGIFSRSVGGVFEGNELTGNGADGLYSEGARSRVVDNQAYGNGSWGIRVSTGGGSGNRVVVEDNVAVDNGHGISVNGDAVVGRNNRAWSNNNVGIGVYGGALAQGNESWDNTTGVDVNNATSRGNQVYGNRGTGIWVASGVVEGNRVYDNGGAGIAGYYGLVTGNVVWENRGIAAIVVNTYGDTRVENNTIYAASGDGIRVQATGARLKNNIIWVGSGYAINVDANVQPGFSSDYNLFHLTGTGRVAYWEDRGFETRTDWFYEVGFDAHSITGDPRFVDIDGADDVLGYVDARVSGGTQIVDDGDAGFTTSGAWTTVNGGTGNAVGRGGDYAQAATNAGATADWNFTGLESGWYRVSVTWPVNNFNSQNVRYEVRDGSGALTGVLNGGGQYYSATNDEVAEGSGWRVLGLVRVLGDEVTVRLLAQGDGARPTVADGLRLERLGGDYGADDDWRLQSGSPGIDRGDPAALALTEPWPNGGRIDLGAYGNTVQTTGSADPLVQVLSPNGLEKVEVGQTVQIDFRTAGLLQQDVVAQINTGNANAALGNWLVNGYQVSGGTTSTGTAVNVTGVVNAAPAGVYQSAAVSGSNVGDKLGYVLPVADGTYKLRLHLSENWNVAVGTRRFDVAIDGAVVDANVDIRARAGAAYTALVQEYEVEVSGGELRLELINLTQGHAAALSGLELLRVNAQGVETPTVDLQVSTDDGANWRSIASGLTVDALGRGSYQWVVDAAPTSGDAGNTARIRAVATANTSLGEVRTASDVSDEGFLITNAGNVYYVNDGSLAGDEYTTGVGDNANDGKSAATPMASLAALLRAYDLDAGDVIYVDTGLYNLATNIVLEAQDSGVRIVGASQPGHQSILDRGNVTNNTRVFELAGADDITLEHLTMRGAYAAVVAGYNVGSTAITIRDSEILGNYSTGIYVDGGNDGWRFEGNAIHANGGHGIDLRSGNSVVVGNEVYANGSSGISAGESRAGNAFTIRVEGNRVHDNINHGISVSGNVIARGNAVYNHRGGGSFGMTLGGNAIAEGNSVHDNRRGLSVSGATARGNEVFANTQAGIEATNALISGNRIYSNPIGISGIQGSRIENNVLYANTNVGIYGSYPYDSVTTVVNNTIYQPVGDGVRLDQNANDIRLYNNIIVVQAGYGLNVSTAVTARLISDYNLFRADGPDAYVGLWAATQRATLADWQAASGRDGHSDAGDPLFLDIDGADNVLGEQGLSQGNGSDDNFGLRRLSPAIDAANAYVASLTDIEDRPRRRDPGVPDSGDGWPLYVATQAGTSDAAARATEVAKSARSGNTNFVQALGFGFEFYGTVYTQVSVNTNGYLHFAGPDFPNQDNNSLEVFQRNVRIAPLWDNLTTGGLGKDVFVDTSVQNQIRIRWAGHLEGSTSEVNFAVTLFADGSFRFDYGAGNTGLTPTVGVSGGNGLAFVLAPYNDVADLASAPALSWQPTPGLTFYDVGAYEFQGDSGDVAPPRVESISNLPVPGGTTGLAFTSLQVALSETLDGVSARSAANYELRATGADGLFFTPDDRAIALRPLYSFPETDLTLQLVDGALPDGLYRLTLSGTGGLFDTAGNALDGNGDGIGGDGYIREFRIDRTANIPPVAADATVVVGEDGSITITLAGTDGNDDPLSFGIVTNPAHGTLSPFDPATRQLIYTPHANFNGTDSFRFRVDDGNLGSDEGTITLRVTPVNDAPTAAGAGVTTAEDTPLAIALPGADVETPRDLLQFDLVAGPAHGTLVLGAGGVWTYTPDADFTGADSFTYRARDLGDPSGVLTNAATSDIATISITVASRNDAPVIAPIVPKTVDEGSLLSFTLPASDAEGDALTYTLLTAVPGASLDATTGVFTWQPSDGPGVQVFSVRVGDGVRSTEASFTVNVADVPPTIAVAGDAVVNVSTPYTITFGATDPGADSIIGWIVNWGDGRSTPLAASATSATITYGLGGLYAITVTAIDEDGSHVSEPFDVQVLRPNRAPSAFPQAVTLNEDGTATITLGGFDPDSDPLTFTLVDLPQYGSVSAIDPVTRRIVYTPTADWFGSDSFTFRVGDGQDFSAAATVALTVRSVNDAPVFGAVDDVTAGEGDLVTIDLPVTDVDTGDTLTYELLGGPAGAVVLADGTFQWAVPVSTPAGAFDVTVRATDAAGAMADASFTIHVTAPVPLQVTRF